MATKHERTKNIRNFITGGVLFLALFPALAALLDLMPRPVGDLMPVPVEEPPVPQISNTEISDLRREVARLRRDQQLVRSAIDEASVMLGGRVLSRRLQLLENRQANLERVILNDPAKALELPLLRRDLDNSREANAQSLVSVKASVDQVYDINKWLLGAMALSIIGLAVTNFLTRKEG
jgi:hypothetical protein